jgi:SAM-dependent methyltransferase
MFFVDAPAAFANIARAIRPGGRVLFAVWQAPSANTWMRVIASALAPGGAMPAPPPDAPGPVSMADPERVKRLLGGAGFDQVELASAERDMCFGKDVEETYEFAAGQPCVRYLLKDLDDLARAEGLARLRGALAERLTPDGVLLPAAAWLVTAVRR